MLPKDAVDGFGHAARLRGGGRGGHLPVPVPVETLDADFLGAVAEFRVSLEAQFGKIAAG